MDVMMSLTTEDVQRLRGKFSTCLKLGEFVALLRSNLRDRIHSELDFVVGVIELFHTIDVNGDGELDWDEFAGYMMDAGIAKADFITDEPVIGGDKEYAPLSLPPRDAKTPLNNIRSRIQQMVFATDLNAVAYFEHNSDVVYLYGLQFDRNDGPHHISTMRLHTAFQEHIVIGIEYVPVKKLLVTSSVLEHGYISVWSLADTRNPVVIRRFDSPSAHEHLLWIPSLKAVASSAVLFPRIYSEKDPSMHRRDCFRPNAGNDQPYTKANQIVLWDLSGKKLLNSTGSSLAGGAECRRVVHERLRGVTALAVFKWINRTHLVVGREDGMITIVDAESAEEVDSFDAHGNGVKVLAYSNAVEVLASAGYHSYSDETTLHVLIWKKSTSSTRLRTDARLRGHEAPVELLAFVDSKRQLVTVDRSDTFLVFSSVIRSSTSEPWECLQTYHGQSCPLGGGTRLSQTMWSIFVVPETPASDAVMITAGQSLRFYDHCEVKDREDIFYTYYCSTLNLILGATSSKLVLWKADTGMLWKTHEYVSIVEASIDPIVRSEASRKTAGLERVITAVCLDDRERKIVVGDDFGCVKIVNVINGNVMKELDPHDSPVIALSYSLNGKCVLSISTDSMLHISDEDSPTGYYVPFGGGPISSVLLQSLRFEAKTPQLSQPAHPQSKLKLPGMSDESPEHSAATTGNAQHQKQRFSVLKAIANQELNVIAVLIHGSEGESFVQLWTFDLNHTQGTCVVPKSAGELTTISFLGSSSDIVGATSIGRVFLWPDPGSDSAQRCVVELPAPDTRSDVGSATLVDLSILYLATLFVEETAELNGTGRGASAASLSSHQDSDRSPSLSSKEWSRIFFRNHSIDERIQHEKDAGVYVFAGDEQGYLTVWRVRRLESAPDTSTFMTRIEEAAQSTNTTRRGAPAASNNSVQHGETVVGNDSIAALYQHAVNHLHGRSTTQNQQSQRIESVQLHRWQAHAEAIASLEFATDPQVLLTSSGSGKIKVWSFDGVLYGVIDQYATRRVPTQHPWKFPVDMEERRSKQEAEARRYLQKSSTRNGGSGGHWRPNRLHSTILQERLQLTEQELGFSHSHAHEPIKPRRRELRQSDIGRAIRSLILFQARPRPQPPQSDTSNDDHAPLRVILKDLDQLRLDQPVSSATNGVAAGQQRRKWPMASPANVKPGLFRSRSVSSSIHCDLPSSPSTASSPSSLARQRRTMARGLSLAPSVSRPRELLVTAASTRSSDADRFGSLRDLDVSEPRGSNQERHRVRNDNVLKYHVKLAHSWNPPTG